MHKLHFLLQNNAITPENLSKQKDGVYELSDFFLLKYAKCRIEPEFKAAFRNEFLRRRKVRLQSFVRAIDLENRGLLVLPHALNENAVCHSE
jgi:hypothetical protein